MFNTVCRDASLVNPDGREMRHLRCLTKVVSLVHFVENNSLYNPTVNESTAFGNG